MKRYSVAHVRERLADVLDEADAGGTIVIERRGVRYVLRLQENQQPRRADRVRPAIEVLDPSVADGQWEWTMSAKGVRFSGRRRS
jgi:antitoxin (DNA-binding transcriptional repressor) of toxin-antitoxin stability system